MYDLSILPPIARDCGECTACCRTHITEEMKLDGGEYCDACHIGTGCTIYQSRPIACQAYRCIWVCGKGNDEDRPDRLGVVIDMKIATYLSENDITAVNFWEVHDGAVQKPRVQQVMMDNIKAGNIAVARPYEAMPRYYFPKGQFSPEEQQIVIEIVENTPGPLLQQ